MREPGFYKVKIKKYASEGYYWTISLFEGGIWWMVGDRIGYEEQFIAEINENRIKLDDEN